MLRKPLMIVLATVFACSFSSAADTPPPQTKLSAAEIVDRNVLSRGGLQAWRSVQTMSMTGTLGAGGNQRATLPTPMPGRKKVSVIFSPRPADEVRLPFTMYLTRPRKLRIELQFNGETALQVFDGING